MNSSIPTADFETEAMPHLNDLFRSARRILGNAAEAEDAVQEAYYQAWKSFHRFQPGTNCRAWLFKILFHVIQHQRRKWWKVSSFANLDEMPEQVTTWEPPVPQDLTDEEVLQAFDRLPQQYREVVLLADVQEFAYKEIADILNIPIGTVMSRLNRGRKLLRTELAGLAAGYGIETGSEAARSFTCA
ncbi:MAG TPA: sigma-70 family RNA polymerase sigma factor [Blastocatellia bacterium]|nr:sigma-70 family RNA polymerase sigma factor [Blastocatellia bacterium]